MNKSIQKIQNILEQNNNLNSDLKRAIMEALKPLNKELEITTFKLERTEQVKKTTAILLEETIHELEQKRKAVEAQNRELEIETSLERVRAIALSMKKPADMVDVCRTISDQLEQLNVTDIRNIQTAIIDNLNGTYLNYEYFTQYKTSSILEIETKLHPVVEEFAKQITKSKDAFFTKTFEGEALKNWIRYRKETNQNEDPILETSKSIHYYFYSIGPGALGISTYSPLNEENITIFKRFRNVFALTYQRFIDIELAMAQAREAQIESALERIRSLALGMKKSEEVGNVTDLLFTELTKLSVDVIGCSIVVIDEENDKMELWRARSNIAVKPFDSTSFAESMDLLKKYMPDWFPIFFRALKNRKNHLLDELSEKRRLQFIDAIAEQYNYSKTEKSKLIKNIPEEIKAHYIFFKLGYLGLLAEKKLSDENLSIVKRFIEVFDFAYTRFLDIKNAEAQAREAQIEAALERVRSKAMAMHKSDDLTSSVAIVFSELDRLGFKTIRCGIGIFNDKSRHVNVWTASSSNETETAHLSGDEILEGHPLLEKIYDAWQNQVDCSYTLKGKELIKYYKYTAKSNLPVEAPELISDSTAQYYHCVMFPAGGLFAFRDKEFSEEAVVLMKRFSDVFHLAFTRHLDLKQAEEQNKIILAENNRKTLELEEAREMQISMLPKILPKLPNLDIAVYMKTATEVGGDYYDYCFSDNGSLNICLGDATGHGMKAGIMVSAMKSIFTTNAPKMGIEDFFNNANSGIKSMNLKRMMMGFTMLNINKNKFKLINAGMPPIFLYRKKFHAVDEIIAHGMPIGAMNNSIYTVSDLSFERGDVILLMSDGMPELQNDKNDMFGYKRIQRGFKNVAEKTAKDIIDYLKSESEAWVNEKVPDDDVTFLVIKVKS